MIVVRIEMWPGGNKARARLLGLILIVNDGKGDQETGHYNVTVSSKRAIKALEEKKDPSPFVKTARVENWKRKARTIYALVGKAIKAAKA